MSGPHVAWDLAVAGPAGFAWPGGVDIHQAPTFRGWRWQRENSRHAWWASTFDTLFAEHRPKVCVVEGPVIGGQGDKRPQLYQHGVLRLAAAYNRVRVVEVPASSLKLWATGSGRADKPQMIAAAIERGAPADVVEADDGGNAADAWLAWCWWASRDHVRGTSEAV